MNKAFRKGVIRTAVLAGMACVTMAAAFSFVMVSAAGEVSLSDITSHSDLSVISDYISRSVSLAGPKEQTVSVTREAPDFLLSNMPARKGVGRKFRKFLPSASYRGSYKSELGSDEVTVYNGFYSAFVENKKNDSEKFSVTFDNPVAFDVVASDPANGMLSADDLGRIDDIVLSAAAAFFYDCPEVFWIRTFKYTVNADLTTGIEDRIGYVDRIEFSFSRAAYPNAYDDLSAYRTGLEAAVNSIRQSRKNESVYETAKAIHDYIIYNASYNYDAMNGSAYTYGYAYSPAPLFVSRLKGKMVCEGYSKAMKILCNEFGISCALVSGTGMTSDSSSGPHMWCYLQIDGNWYAVDATWDDGYFNQNGKPCPMYHYFLAGSSTFVKGNRTFAQSHINDGQVMSTPTQFSMVYPPLSESMYDHYILDTDPAISLTTLGASIKLTEPYGIRFGVQIKRDEGLRSVHLIPEFGTLLIGSGTLGSNELTITTPNVLKIKAERFYDKDETQYTYTGVLTNIPKSSFGTRITGRGYLIYVDDATGEEHIIYSGTIERSFYGVAQTAYDYYAAIDNPDDYQKTTINQLEDFLQNK